MKELNINLPPFYVGQKVVCVKPAPTYGLIKDKIYTITAVVKFNCGTVLVAYGQPIDITRTACHCGCRQRTYSVSQLHACSTRFAPYKEAKMPLLTLSKVLEEVTLSSN